MQDEAKTPQSASGSETSGSAPTPRGEGTDYLILLWLPEGRVWQELGTVKTASREDALEAALKLADCPLAEERPALSAVPVRYWQPQIASPPPPPDGHEWRAFVPTDSFSDPEDTSAGLEVG